MRPSSAMDCYTACYRTVYTATCPWFLVLVRGRVLGSWFLEGLASVLGLWFSSRNWLSANDSMQSQHVQCTSVNMCASVLMLPTVNGELAILGTVLTYEFVVRRISLARVNHYGEG